MLSSEKNTLANDREFIFGLKAQSCERRVIIQLRPRTSQ